MRSRVLGFCCFILLTFGAERLSASADEATLEELDSAISEEDAPTVERLANQQLSSGSLTPSEKSTMLSDRAWAHQRLNRLQEAHRDYVESLMAGNTQPQYAYYGLGELSEAEGDNKAAKMYYSYALIADPQLNLASDKLKALGDDPDELISSESSPILLLLPKLKNEVSNTRTSQYLSFGEAKSTIGPQLRRSLADPHVQVRELAQLGAWRSEVEAAKGWKNAVLAAQSILSNASPSIVPVDLPGKGRYFRLRVETGMDAKRFCTPLTIKGIECEPVRR